MADDKKKRFTIRNKSIINAFESFNNVIQQRINKTIQMIVSFVEQDKERFKKEYEELLPTIEAYCKKHGWIMPKDAEEFYNVFLFKIIDPYNEDDIRRSLDRKDFKRFHEILDKEMQNENTKLDQSEKRGNPKFKKNKVSKPDDVDNKISTLLKNHDEYSQEAIALEIIADYDHLTEKQLSTVKRWIRKNPEWSS